jgi:hypothetical protein
VGLFFCSYSLARETGGRSIGATTQDPQQHYTGLAIALRRTSNSTTQDYDNPRNRGDPTCTEFGNGPFLGDLGTVLGVVLGVVLGRPEARFF